MRGVVDGFASAAEIAEMLLVSPPEPQVERPYLLLLHLLLLHLLWLHLLWLHLL